MNKYLKLGLASVLSAGFIGLSVFGYNIAFGIDTPILDPTGSTGVSPTFTGVTVLNDSDLHGNVADSTGNLTLDDIVDVTSDLHVTNLADVDGNFEISGLIFNPNTVGDFIPGNPPFQGGSASIPVLFDDLVSFRDHVQLQGNSYFNDDLILSSAADLTSSSEHVTVGDSLNVTEYIVNTTVDADLVLNDSVDISNNLQVQGSATVWNKLIADRIEVEDGITNFLGGPVEMGGGLDLTGDLSVSGSIDFDLTERSGGTVVILPGNAASASVSCLAGETLINCGVFGSSRYVDPFKIYVEGGECYVVALNTHATTKYTVQARALCAE